MNNCGTCKNWTQSPDFPDAGRCAKINTGMVMQQEVTIDGAVAFALYTGTNFGCTLWEEILAP